MDLVGLGNPGPRYAYTRHNIGWLLVRAFCQKVGISLKASRMAQALMGTKEGIRAILPTTYMNLSGGALKEVGVQPEHLLLLYDDLALPLGTIRLRKKGGGGGHNGVSSVIFHLETEAFHRLRLGIGPLPQPINASDYVLSPFTKSEEPLVEEMIQNGVCTLYTYIEEGVDRAMNTHNKRP